VLVGRKDGPLFEAEADLSGRTIALEQGFYNVNYFQHEFSCGNDPPVPILP